MKKGKSKKSAPKKESPSYLKQFLFALSGICSYALVIIIAGYFLTGYAMFESNQFFDLIHLDKATAIYMHKQLTMPFCVCMILHLLPDLMK